MAKITELSAEFKALKATLLKAKDEIIARVAKLEESLENQDIPAEAQTELDGLKQVANALDALNPDADAAEGGNPA